MADPYYNNVSLLLPMDGTNNSTTFTDYSPSPKTVTRFGDTKISTAQSKWGNGSGYFDGSGDYLTLDNTTDLDFGSGDFTIEVFLFCTVSLSTGAIVQKRIGNGVANTNWVLSIDEGTVYFTVSNGSAYIAQINSGSVIETNQWIHIAASRYSGTLTLWVNGVSAGSSAVSGAISSTSMTSYIGRDPGGDTYFTGYLQDLRITKGVARYTADFTPPGRLVISRPTLITDGGLWQTLSGNCIKSGAGGADLVAIHDWTDRQLIATAIPNATTGDWTASVPAGTYSITYSAADCQPICHGPYTVS